MRPDGEKGGFIRSKTAERLSTSPHYCLRELSGRVWAREEGKWVRLGGAMKGEQRQFSTRSPE